jgi:hypothetical protein
MNDEVMNVYTNFIGFRASQDLSARLERFSRTLGRQRSDVIRYLLVSCLSAYEADRDAISKIKQELY